MEMTIDKYVSFRLGPGSVVRMVWNMFWCSFTALTLSAFWRYWNPGYGFFLLKYCYGPLRKHVPHAVALILTFGFCGFFAHDCLVLIPAALMVHENFRFQPWHREIKQLLARHAIGDQLHTISFRSRTGDGWQADAYLARQPYFRTMSRFLIFETGVHFIDTFRFLAGEIDGVYASLRKLNADIAGEDTATVLFEFESGAEDIWDANRFNEPNVTDARYTFGEALLEGNGGSIRLYSDGRVTIQRLGESERDHNYEHGKKNFASDCVLETQRHFVQCVKDSRPFETSGDNYLRTLAVQEAIYQSAKSRQPVRGLTSGEVTDASH